VDSRPYLAPGRHRPRRRGRTPPWNSWAEGETATEAGWCQPRRGNTPSVYVRRTTSSPPGLLKTDTARQALSREHTSADAKQPRLIHVNPYPKSNPQTCSRNPAKLTVGMIFSTT